MALPAAIQAQVEQADALLAAMNAPQESQAPAPTAPQAPQVQEVDLSQLAQTAQASNQPQAEQQAPAPAPQTSEETWERKFKSLQGIFNKEVPTLQGQVKELTARLNQAVEQMEARNKAPEPEQAAHKPEADPKDIDNFGEDLVEMVQRTAERTLGSVVRKIEGEFSKLVGRIATLEKQLEGTTQSVALTAEEKFFDRLVAKVPDWEAINADPLFIEWLQEADPVYGVPRQVALNNARETLNADRAAAVFTAFAGVPTNTPAGTQSPVDKQVSPKTGAANAAPVQQTVQIISQQQVTAFYNDVARGRYRGREAEAAGLEQAINLAIAEGRVR